MSEFSHRTGMYPHMTVVDNMSFALKLAKVDVAVREQKVERAAQILNLTQYLQRRPKELSGGQRRRVAIGRAIVRAPKVFLFDEPLSKLDAAVRGQTRGRVFVGDYIGYFGPGHLVLTGPRLPHNWISTDVGPEGVAQRDMVLQFSDEPLKRARLGIELFGLTERARASMRQIKRLHGIKRFGEFLNFLGELAECTDYRLLSGMPLQSFDDDQALAQISTSRCSVARGGRLEAALPAAAQLARSNSSNCPASIGAVASWPLRMPSARSRLLRCRRTIFSSIEPCVTRR
jgi:hypothetical protein